MCLLREPSLRSVAEFAVRQALIAITETVEARRAPNKAECSRLHDVRPTVADGTYFVACRPCGGSQIGGNRPARRVDALNVFAGRRLTGH